MATPYCKSCESTYYFTRCYALAYMYKRKNGWLFFVFNNLFLTLANITSSTVLELLCYKCYVPYDLSCADHLVEGHGHIVEN